GLLAFGDVYHRADEAHGLAVVVFPLKVGLPLRSNPSLLPIFDAHRSVFDAVVPVAVWLERLLHHLMGPLSVFGMEALKKNVVVDLGLGREAEERFAAVVPAQRAREGVKVPGANLCSAGRQ